ANLDDARLVGADLSGAFLYGTRVSLKSLSTAKSLANATMPDGTKYEDWIRNQSNESRPSNHAAPPARPVVPDATESPLDFLTSTEGG
ncbi:MAG: hypothetical protein KBF17_09605, partial [Candidatus Promineofilum sp.]|nr:hypothetical protein [Promineifilum sp.]